MSTDCGVIVIGPVNYLAYGYCKWDGYPQGGKGEDLYNIVKRATSDTDIYRNIDEAFSRNCESVPCATLEEAYGEMYDFLDYIYVVDVVCRSVFVSLSLFSYKDLPKGYSIEDYKLAKRNARRFLVEFDDYLKLYNILYKYEEEYDNYIVPKNKFIKKLKGMSNIDDIVEYVDNNYTFLNNNLMETE